ncbi:hypothetical protein O181_093358 [Austropuccinia psidii MF-1]|uniref:Chromo domain-containing protein n=1 Tax=Austropuccinia psidii MF-1 TaxID=1389203 RepID=A0A9Q3J052_9BASI|nr:hypothetical protein [Austropuccinia psidii MF-1]
MEPAFKEGGQVLVSTLNFNNLKGPKKMRDLFGGPFTIIEWIGKMQWKSKSQRNFPGNTQSFKKKNPTPTEIVEVESSIGPVNKAIKARKMKLNGRDQRQYSVRFKDQTAENYKWFAEDAIPDGNLHLRRFRASRSTGQSHQL